MVSPHDKLDHEKLDPYVKKQNAKLTQVVQNFFTKSLQVILTARSENIDHTNDSKLNKWFNLLIPVSVNSSVNKDELKLWKSCGDLSSIPPMIIETSVDLRHLTNKNSLMLRDSNGNSWGVIKDNSKKNEVVIERWLIEFDTNEVSGSIIDELPLIYKQAIILFRNLYGFLRLMPAFKLRNSLNDQLSLTNRIIDGKQPISSKGRIGLSKSIIPHQMLTTDSHLIQKNFHTIQTSLGTLKVSTIYRRHADFALNDNDDILMYLDEKLEGKLDKSDEKLEEKLQDKPDEKLDVSVKSMSISPNTRETPNIPVRPSIQPFRVGSIGTSPPPQSLERRISITSNKSTSNASLAAMLRNPRGSGSSTIGNIPISNSISQNANSVPRSISSSHGESESPNPEAIPSSTPRFSSSFGSRASRRFSNTSVRQSILQQNLYDQSYLGTSAGLTTSTNPLSGLYLDDDISDFVRMIDSKTDLRFTGKSPNSIGSQNNNEGDVLNKFQLMKYQHQQLGDSVNQSLILQQNNPSSQVSSRKSSHSQSISPFERLNPSNQNLPTIDSKLERNEQKLLPAPEKPISGVKGLSTTPSVYANRRSIQYENVFEDDDDGEDYYLQLKGQKNEEEDDDLLFTMSDMNLTKH